MEDVNQNNGRQGQDPSSTITVTEWSAKASSKYETWVFLTVTCGYFLPHHTAMTSYWMKDLISGKKKGKSQHEVP